MKSSRSYLRAISALLFCLPLVAFSQNFEVSSSIHDFIYSSAKRHKIIGHDPDHYYVIKFQANQYYLQKLNKDLSPVVEQPIKLYQGIKTFELINVVHFHQELYVFFTLTRLNNITLYYQKIDKGNMSASTENIEVTTIQNIKGSWADIYITLSRHETKLLIACITKLSWSKDQFNEFYVYGEGLTQLWKRKDTYQFKGLGPRDNQYVVDEQGNVSILSVLKNENIFSVITRTEERNLYSIYRYTHDGQTFREYPVTLGARYIRGIRIISGEQGELICAGLYSELFNTGIRGTFYYKIDPETGRIYDNSLNPYDEPMMSHLAAVKEPMRKERELVYYIVTDLLMRENGTTMMIAEQVFDQSYDTYNNLIVTFFDSQGAVNWNRLVEKNQDFNYTGSSKYGIELSDYRDHIMGTGYIYPGLENYCSYALMAPIDKTSIVIFFNDDIRNRDNPGERKNFSRPRKSYILAVAIDESGNIKRESLTAWTKKALYPEPVRFYDTLHETIVIPAFRGRKYNYYRITATF
jgi:hypothetical protein